MGRSSKFAFPLPGRRAQARREATDAPVLPPTIPLLPDPLVPDFTPSPKARRLLGAQSNDCSNPGPANGASPLQRAVSPSLDSKRSYMSITVSDASQSSTSAYKTSTTVPPDPEIVQYAARIYPVAPEEPTPDPQSSNQPAKLRSKRSRLGLGSHYDPKKAPLSVSQQTSASAIAHGGLRRGHIRRHSSPNSLYHQSDDEEPSALPDDTDHHPSAMDTPARRKASPKLDLSRLFNKPSKSKESSAGPMLSPTKFVTSPTSLSTNSLHFYAPEPTLKPQQEMMMTGAGSSGFRAESGLHAETSVPAEPRAPVTQPAARVYRDACETAKIHVRRPPPGIQHWFDGLGESDDDDDEYEDESETEWPLGEDVAKSIEVQSHTTYQPYRPPELGVEQFYNDKRCGTPSQKSIRSSRSDSRLKVRARSKSRSRSRPRSKLSVRSRSQSRPKSRSREALDELHLDGSPLKISETLSPPKIKQRRSLRRNSSKLTHTDLKGASVLSLSSSSSDDSESGASSTDMPNIRESLSILTDADKDVDIQVGRARALEVTRPRQSLEHIRRASESPSECSARGSTTTATIDIALAPSAPSSATSTEFPRRAPSTRRPNHPGQLSTVEDAEEGRGSFYDASTNSEPEKVAQQPANTSEDADVPKRKLMAVTREEEILLELMRRKRASMAKQNFTDGYNTALKLEHQRGIISPLVEEFHKNSGRRTSEQGLQPGPHHGAGYRHSRTQSLSTNMVFPERTSSLRPSGEFLPSTVYKSPHPKHKYRSTSSSISGTLASLNRISHDSNGNMPPLPTKAMLPFRESRPPQLPLNIFSPLDLFSPYSPSVMTTNSVNDSALPSPRSPNPVFDSSFRESKALTAVCDSVIQNQDEFQSIPLTSSDSTQEKNEPADHLENQPRERPARSSHSRKKSRDQSPPKFCHVLARQPSFTYATAGLQRPTHPIWHHRNASRETLESGFAVANPYNQSQTQTQTLAVPSHRRSSQLASRPQSQAYSSDGRPSTASPDSMLSISTSTATMTTLSDSAAHAISGPPGAITNGKPTVPVRLRTGSTTATSNTTTSSSTARHSNTPNFSQKLVGSNAPSCRTSSASGSGSSGDRSSSSIDAASCRPRSSIGTAKSLRSSGSGVAITTTLEEGQDAAAYGVYGFGLEDRGEGDRTSVCEDVYAAWNSLGGGRAGLF
ncbi:hypothetical protein IWX90DRAFT_427416 [Phyllosticta citrichinensis]|uniref:Uncharacterized protein n=1 Tax=Phyllosticta citrichinensis TaxID=1130410 RepID=A0ABR1XZ59_9PEZI